MKKFLAADFSLTYNFDDPNKRYQKFLSQGRDSFKRLIENILLYDNIVIPTQDYLSLSVLIGVLGEDEVIELLKNKSISFLRTKGALAYLGNGGGVQSYLIGGPNEPLAPFCAPIDEAIDWALSGLEQKTRNNKLPQLVADATTEFEISKIAESVKHETYMDILKSSELKNIFAIRNTDLNRLAGIGPKEVRIYGGRDSNWTGDEIDIVMGLTSTNIELRMMELTECADATTDNPIRVLLETKAERTLQRSSEESFTELKEISRLPDIGEAVLKKQVSLHKILDIAHSSDGKKFKEWFHINCRKDTITTAREYSELLRQIPFTQSNPSRMIRFVVTNLVGLAGGVAAPIVGAMIGVGASAVDSFFIDKLLHGSSPKFFIDKLENLTSKTKRN